MKFNYICFIVNGSHAVKWDGRVVHGPVSFNARSVVWQKFVT